MIPDQALQDGFIFAVCFLMVSVGISLIVRLIHLGWCYCLIKDGVVKAYFGNRDEVLEFFHCLCDVTKDSLPDPMFKSNSFSVAKYYLRQCGYELKFCNPGRFNHG